MEKENKKSTQKSEVKEMFNKQEEIMKKMMEVPTQAADLMVESTQKVQEASISYLRSLEQIQREYVKGMSSVVGTLLPGENKLWDAQVKAIEEGFNMFDRMLAGVSAK